MRFDGGHKHDRYLTDILGRYLEFVPVCPEAEVGMGIPREPVSLHGDPAAPRMIGNKSKEVRLSKRLTESPACLVVGEQDMGAQMRRIMEQAGQPVPRYRGGVVPRVTSMPSSRISRSEAS